MSSLSAMVSGVSKGLEMVLWLPKEVWGNFQNESCFQGSFNLAFTIPNFAFMEIKCTEILNYWIIFVTNYWTNNKLAKISKSSSGIGLSNLNKRYQLAIKKSLQIKEIRKICLFYSLNDSTATTFILWYSEHTYAIAK